ncbi:ABC transporter related sn-glycerol-3-phosphate import ATP-binding protein UgpC [Sinorhizobium fredii NGR234]|uniref:ABC transporter related sn-glycerol-3-phosphate import ATP-binding protein UgpC n=1 Tax=Sinorhizobium fredii (strain NBRC 101917 / NGR234) TaxID=394 RepID=C3MCV4_SINFN|nr:sn-glycerol-3-phosphate import ATP-binding protein UgpC [Sinorhizobium fredii]ACP27402.1 ABC transporter related sn-glycerol-3-phosphate import ATP-binding protein UgpC [Sinorhizobium fredii NGR234]
MAAIDIVDVSKIYSGNIEAVKSVSIDIADGEFIVLVGPSGCGKSTLLRMVAGLETISKGTVTIGTRLINDVEPAERDIAMVFQNYALYPHMTVFDNLAYGLRNRKTPKTEIDARVAEAARMLEIEPYLDRKPRALSGGQRQRVAMGRAIVRKPAAFLFDEPLSNLDAKLRVSMRGEIKRLQKRLGTTSLYVTHDQLEAMTLADRLVVLNGGRIEQIGRPLEVYHAPASTFVASFIGSPAMNLLRGALEGGRLHIGTHGIDLAYPVPAEGPVTVGLRAEDLRPASPGEQALLFRVDYVEELGAQRLVHGMVEDQALTVSLAPETPLADEVAIAIPMDRLHFFSADSGKRLNRPRVTEGAADGATAAPLARHHAVNLEPVP